MRIFVASWFYVPVTTSEALVTYKLFSNSRHEYVVCSARSNKWSYNKAADLTGENIEQHIIDTEDFGEFVEKSVEIYRELSKEQKFDAIMTRSLPPESQHVGFKIKEFDPDVKWIASLADPIGNNPYETYVYFLQHRRRIVRSTYYHAPYFFLDKVCGILGKKRVTFRLMHDLYQLEQRVVREADVIITPNETQADFIIHDKAVLAEKSLVVPHSYDSRLYPSVEPTEKDSFVFTFIGHSDALRSVEPFVRAVAALRDLNPDLFRKIKVRLIGNIPSNIRDMVYVYFLQDTISVEGPCDYFKSLEIMQQSDCLLHVDAWFDHLENGSIFFAAKIADYLGARKPILGITDPNCPAGKIITACGGLCCKAEDPYNVAKLMVSAYEGRACVVEEEAVRYDAKTVAKNYDDELERRLLKNEK